MAPTRWGKGKRPMTESATEPQRRVTRSRGLGIHIAEPHESSRHETVEEVHVEPEQAAQGVFGTEQEANVHGRGRTPPPVHVRRGHEGPRPSTMAELGVDSGVTPQQMTTLRQLVVGAMQGIRQDMREDMRHEMRQLLEAQSQQRTSSDPVPSTGPIGQAQTLVRGQAEVDPEPEVGVADVRRQTLDERSDMRAFQDMRPPSFVGETDYTMTDRWVSRMEKIFEYLQCTEEQRVRYATYMLEGDAEDWWRTERETLPRHGAELTWTGFLDRFYRHYVPASERARRAAEFASLTQGSLSVGEYDARYRSLSRFVGWTQTDLREKARKFQEGLKPSIRGKVALFRLEEYAEILDIARTVEREEGEWAKAQERRRGMDQRRSGRGRFRDLRARIGSRGQVE